MEGTGRELGTICVYYNAKANEKLEGHSSLLRRIMPLQNSIVELKNRPILSN
jgi:hypothetical protein